MANAKIFGDALAKLRKERGFSGAHKFFKCSGGSKTLEMSFTNYWDLERGKKLPKSGHLKAIMAALGVMPNFPQARALVRAYYTALSGTDELLQILAGPAAPGAGLPGAELADTIFKQAMFGNGERLTPEQWELHTRDMETYLCMCYLTVTADWVTVQELSSATRFKLASVRSTLKALAAGKLIELSGDKARTPLAHRCVLSPAKSPETAAIFTRINNYWDKWLAAPDVLSRNQIIVRMSGRNMDSYRLSLAKAVGLAAAYHNSGESREDSEVYYIESRIFKAYRK
jgi:transcriptional regulator with XRE-family HTH domain